MLPSWLRPAARRATREVDAYFIDGTNKGGKQWTTMMRSRTILPV